MDDNASTETKYLLQRNYLSPSLGWTRTEEILEGFTYEEAGEIASRAAKELDRKYGNSHFWTVDLKNLDTSESYFQLFHGRLS